MTQTNPEMTPPAKASPIKKLFDVSFRALCVSLLTVGCLGVLWVFGKDAWNATSRINVNNEKWEALAQTSTHHQTLVTAYRNCRNKAFGGSVEECLLVANDYGKLMGIDSDLTAIIHDIKSTSDSIIKK